MRMLWHWAEVLAGMARLVCFAMFRLLAPGNKIMDEYINIISRAFQLGESHKARGTAAVVLAWVLLLLLWSSFTRYHCGYVQQRRQAQPKRSDTPHQ